MDFNDDRSIFSNSQLALDNMQNLTQNDYLQNYDETHMMQYFVNDSLLNVSNQYDPQPPQIQNVLCSNQSNLLKAQNSNHPPQSNLNSNLNRSRNQQLNQHHHYQQTTPQSHTNQFHNPAPTSTKQQQFISNVSPINQQQINYANIPDKDKSLIYTEVVNHNNVLPSVNVFNNNEINHQLHQRQMQQSQLVQQQQSQNAELIKSNNTNNLINKNQTTSIYSNDANLTPNNLHQPTQNSLPSINKNGSLLNDSVQKNCANNNFYSPPLNYHFNQQRSSPQPMNNNNMNNNMNNNNMNNNINNNLGKQQQALNTNTCFIDKKPINSNGLNFNDYSTNNNNNSNLINIKSPPIIDTKAPPSLSDNLNNNSLNNYNSISSSPSNLNSPPTINKSQLSELNNSLTVNRSDQDGTKQKAETKTLYLLKIIDQIIYNGIVVKEIVVKDDELVKHNGYIDWPLDSNQTDSSSNNSLIQTTTKTSSSASKNNSDKSTKRNSTPKNKNLKRSSGQPKDNKEKKVKTELKTKIDFIKAESKVESKNENRNETTDEQLNVKPIKAAKKDTTTNIIIKESPISKEILNLNLDTTNLSNIEITPTATKSQQQISTPKVPSSIVTPLISSLRYEVEDPIFKAININQKVLAKWHNKSWYAGTVLSKENDSKWRILFFDGGRRLVRRDEIISIEHLPIGQQVMINYSSSYCAKGYIKSYRFDTETNEYYYLIDYVINMKNIEAEHSEKDVFLTGDIALSLLSRRKQNVNDSKFADVDLNNIIPKGRSRAVSNKNPNEANTSADNSLSDKTLAKLEIDYDSNSNLSTSTNSSATTSSSAKKPTTAKKGKTIAQKQIVSPLNVDVESLLDVSKLNTSSNLDLKDDELQINEITIKEEESKIDDTKDDIKNDSFEFSLIGPIPQNQKLFKSFAFLLSFEEQSNSNEVAGFSIPFDIEHLTKQIKNGSGLILENYEDIKDNYQVVLVSHSYLKTVKYMMCLSSGIPCVKFTWIIDSCKKNELLRKEDYILPTGFSILTNNLIQDRNIYKKSSTLFKGTKIYLNKSELTIKWLPLFNASKTVLLDNLPDTTRKPNCDLIVSDLTCDDELIKKANSIKIPIVSIEYIIQCLIHGKRLPCDAHPSFHHNYIRNS